jgi:hypothetical protein
VVPEENKVVPQAHFIVAISYGSCGVWTVVFIRLHKNVSVQGLQNCFLLENFVKYTEA